MNSEELMIGDWVSLFQGNPDGSSCNVQVTSIGEYGDVGINGCEEYTSANCNLLFPISLTAEILEKNFPTIEDGVTWSDTADSDLFNIRAEYDKYVEGIFKYVHELQHALRLAGIDKEIEI